MSNKTLAFIIEGELEKAEVVIAAKSILDKFNRAAKTIADIETDDLMPLSDSLRNGFGPDSAKSFNSVASESVRETVKILIENKEKIAAAIATLEAVVNGTSAPNDMATFEPDEEPVEEPEVAPEPEHEEDNSEIEDVLDTEDKSGMGRVKKESIQKKGSDLLRESSNPDLLVYTLYRKLIKEGYIPAKAKSMTAKYFNIDLDDVSKISKGK